MSNPYAPKSQLKKNVEPAKSVEPVEPQLSDVPDGSIEDVLKWVGDDAEKAELAIEAEEAGKDRTSLLKTLKKVADAGRAS